MTDTKLGTLILEDHHRKDAIHIAVAPVEAGEHLVPGQHVGLLKDGRVGGRTAKPLGVVDPFLTRPVGPGQTFWLLLYPGSILSLRHEWIHPDFQETPNDRDFARQTLAKQRLTVIAKDLGEDYDYVLEKIGTGHISFGSTSGPEYAEEYRDEMLRLYTDITGRRVDGLRFSCAC